MRILKIHHGGKIVLLLFPTHNSSGKMRTHAQSISLDNLLEE
jgi:hypothetical protein